MAKIPDNADILPPSDDRIFKVLLTHPNAKRVLMSVVSTVIERPVIDVKILNTELPVSDIEEKAQRLDINCIIDGGDQINVEMQCSYTEEPAGERDEHIGFLNKCIYYMAALYSSQKSKGKEYYKLARTFQITFCGYEIFPEYPGFVTRVSLRRDTGEQISDQLNMIIVEMSKLIGILNKPAETLTDIEMWTAFFRFAQIPKYRELINKLINLKEEIAMASELLMEISKDDHERALFMSRRKAETDRISNLLTVEERGRTEGIALGRTEGIALGRIEALIGVAKNLRAGGMGVDDIAKATGLTVDDILRL